MKPPRRPRREGIRTIAQVAAILRIQPDATNAEIASQLGRPKASIGYYATHVRRKYGIVAKKGPRPTSKHARLLVLAQELLLLAIDLSAPPKVQSTPHTPSEAAHGAALGN